MAPRVREPPPIEKKGGPASDALNLWAGKRLTRLEVQLEQRLQVRESQASLLGKVSLAHCIIRDGACLATIYAWGAFREGRAYLSLSLSLSHTHTHTHTHTHHSSSSRQVVRQNPVAKQDLQNRVHSYRALRAEEHTSLSFSHSHTTPPPCRW